MTPAQRLAIKRYRENRRKRGLKRLEVQVPETEVAVIRKAAEILRDQATEAIRLRALLGFGPEPGGASSALDVFAMTEALSPEGEALWDEAMAQVERERRDPGLSRTRDIDL
jgi:hypothetical protein